MKQRLFQKEGLLSGTLDRYKGITVNSLPEIDFKNCLYNSLKAFDKEGFRAVWLKIPSQKMDYA